MSSAEDSGFLPKTGNCRGLRSYQKSEIIHDFTFRFCERFLRRGDRTIDQMVQAARSGKQNIAEGAKASKTSSEMEIKLTNVARASLEELLIDYQDFLRVRDLPLWAKDSPEALFVRQMGREPDESYESYRVIMETRPAEVIANIAICLVHQANYLLDQQIRRLEKDFAEKGGASRTHDSRTTGHSRSTRKWDSAPPSALIENRELRDLTSPQQVPIVPLTPAAA